MKGIIGILLLASMNTFGQECRTNIIIKKDKDLNKELEQLFINEDFYTVDNSQYYMFALHLDANLQIESIIPSANSNKGTVIRDAKCKQRRLKIDILQELKAGLPEHYSRFFPKPGRY